MMTKLQKKIMKQNYSPLLSCDLNDREEGEIEIIFRCSLESLCSQSVLVISLWDLLKPAHTVLPVVLPAVSLHPPASFYMSPEVQRWLHSYPSPHICTAQADLQALI